MRGHEGNPEAGRNALVTLHTALVISKYDKVLCKLKQHQLHNSKFLPRMKIIKSDLI